MSDECRRTGCDQPARGSDDAMDAHAAAFCSPQCEVSHDHVRDDARDARAAALEEAESRW